MPAVTTSSESPPAPARPAAPAPGGTTEFLELLLGDAAAIEY